MRFGLAEVKEDSSGGLDESSAEAVFDPDETVGFGGRGGRDVSD